MRIFFNNKTNKVEVTTIENHEAENGIGSKEEIDYSYVLNSDASRFSLNYSDLTTKPFLVQKRDAQRKQVSKNEKRNINRLY